MADGGVKHEDVEADRRRKAADLLVDAGPEQSKLDVLLVGCLTNIRYLTGFTGSNAALLLYSDGHAKLFTDPRYTVQANQQVNCGIRIAKGPLTKLVLSDIARSGATKVGFEQDRVTVFEFEALKKDLPSRSELVPVKGIVEKLRMVKDEGEIALIRASVLINSRALDSALRRLKVGMTGGGTGRGDRLSKPEIGGGKAVFRHDRRGRLALSFTACPAGRYASGAGHSVDRYGGSHCGYASDMTRMIYVGKADAKYRRNYSAVLEAQLAAIDAVKAGAKTSALDRAARETLKRHGLDREFIHSTGHGLGLGIHEPPRIASKDKARLEAGMTITIEPGAYIEGWGGIRIEDTVLVTANGCEILTPTSKELREI